MSNSSSQCAPYKNRLGARTSPSNFNSDCTSQRSTRYNDADIQRQERLVECANIVRCALPKKPQEQAAVKAIAADISSKLALAINNEPAGISSRAAAAAVDECRSWLDGSLLNERRGESKIYTAYSALLRYIAHSLESQSSGSIGLPKRVLLSAQADRKPSGCDESIRVDGSIISCSSTADTAALGRAGIRDIVIMSEAKWPQSEQNQAYKQLVRYSRLLYANQHNRRFAWGITMCGAVVRAVLLTHDFMFASASMSIKHAEGRAQFTEFIVALSYCDESQLGFDPTIKWCPKSELWTIECSDFNSHNGAVVKYYARDPVFVAERTFGRHTRGFEASLDPAAVDSPDTFIKDAWPYTSRVLADKSRDELQIIRNIEALLKEHGESTEGCVTALHGGIVRFAVAGSSNMADDCADTIIDPVLAEADAAILAKDAMAEADEADEADECAKDEAYDAGESEEAGVRFRVHRRVAIQPLGRPLHTFDSPYALIIILADVMDAHARILSNCGYLHRDLSINNILGLVGEDGRVKGLLTDHDCTIKVGEARKLWPERTGTLPFMSICNLLGSPVDRTELDDWESLLYIICWLGIHGISKDEQQKYQAKIIAMRKKNPLYYIPLERWEVGTFEQVATAKQADLATAPEFKQKVLGYFKIGGGYDMLKALALLLYQVLFYNPSLSASCHGVAKMLQNTTKLTLEQMIAGESAETIVDPFEKRAEMKNEIVKDLLRVIRAYKEKAKHVLYKTDSL